MTQYSTESLLPLLASPEPAIRHEAALKLRDLGNNAAVEPLFAAIINPANVNHRGTLVYALQTLDCSNYFSQLFDLALFGGYEVQCGALTILEEQTMRTSLTELKDAETKLSTYVPPRPMSEEDANLLRAELSAILAKLF